MFPSPLTLLTMGVKVAFKIFFSFFKHHFWVTVIDAIKNT